MTMQNSAHPPDERLSALAGGDPEVTDDRALRAHVEACNRCRTLVDELAGLRSVLATLPDLAPARPIRLIPPAPDPVQSGSRGWLARLIAPAVVAGAGLVLVGAVGFGSQALQAGASGAFPAQREALNDDAAESAAVAPGDAGEAPAAPDSTEPAQESDGSGDTEFATLADPDTAGPWLLAMGAGVGLLLLALLLRFTVRPRAG